MNDFAPSPKGIVCKCGAAKAETQYFCASCTTKLPEHLLTSFERCRSHVHMRELSRRAAVLLGLPLTHEQQKVCRY